MKLKNVITLIAVLGVQAQAFAGGFTYEDESPATEVSQDKKQIEAVRDAFAAALKLGNHLHELPAEVAGDWNCSTLPVVTKDQKAPFLLNLVRQIDVTSAQPSGSKEGTLSFDANLEVDDIYDLLREGVGLNDFTEKPNSETWISKRQMRKMMKGHELDAVLDQRRVTSGAPSDEVLRALLRRRTGHNAFKSVVRYESQSKRLIIETSLRSSQSFKFSKDVDESEGRKRVLFYSTCSRNLS